MTISLSPEAAQSAWAHLLPQIEASRQMTRLLIDEFPARHLDTTPLPHAGSFADMLWYLSSVYHVFLGGLCEGRFDELPPMPRVRSTASFLAWDDEHFGPTLDKLRHLSGQDLLRPVTFAGMTQCRLDFFSAFLCNVSQHVGQVMAYLSVVLPEQTMVPLGAVAADAELTDDQLSAVAGGVMATAGYSSPQIGWGVPGGTAAGLGALLGGGGAASPAGLGPGAGAATWAQSPFGAVFMGRL